MSNNTISLCIIIKDEADYLNKCLESYKDCVDEIIVVDTGSVDNTKEIAAKYNAKIFDFPWINDFAKARNESLKHATKDWIIWTDADDICTKEGSEKIKIVKDQFPCNKCIGFQVKNSLDGIMGTNFKQIRMVPNFKNLEFEYPVHEQLYPSIEKSGLDMVFSDIQILHTGYVNKDVVIAKQERNKILMEKVIQEKGDHPVIVYMYAGLLKDLKQETKALEWYLNAYEIAIKSKTEEHVALAAPLGMADIYFSVFKDMENFEKWTKVAYDIDKDHPQALAYMAQVSEKKVELEDAINYYNKILSCEEKSMLIPVDINLLKLQAAARLSHIFSTLNRHKDAIKMLEISMEIKTGKKIFHSHEGDIFLEDGKLIEAGNEYLKSINSPDNLDSNAYIGLSKVFMADNSAKDAVDILDLALERFPNKPDIVQFYLQFAKEIGLENKILELESTLNEINLKFKNNK